MPSEAASLNDNYKSSTGSSEEQRLAEVLEIYSHLEYGNRVDMDNFQKAMGYYTGTGQWSELERQQLESEGRPPLTFNFIFSKVNTVTGLEQQIRSGFRAIPVGAEDDKLAMVATAMLKYEDHNKQLQKVFSRAFKTAIQCGRAWIDVGLQHKAGEVVMSNRVRNENVFNVYKDPDSKEKDMSDATFLSRQKWLSIPQLQKTYPDIFGKMSYKEIANALNFSADSRRPAMHNEYENDYPTTNNVYDFTSFVDTEKRRAKIVELYTRRTEDEWFVVNTEGISFPAKNKKDAMLQAKKLNKIAKKTEMLDRFTAFKMPVSKIYMDTFSGDFMIQKEELMPHKHGQFPLVPVYAYLEDTGEQVENFGIIRNLMDPQDEKNKRHSQFTDILNRAPKGGGFFQMGAVDPEMVKGLSTPGSWVGVRGQLKDKIQPSAANYIGILGHYQWLEQSSMNDAKEISGINDSLIGIPTNSRESGVAAQTRIQQGLTSLQELFDNLNTAKQMVLSQVLSNVQQYYDPQKIKRAIGIVHRAKPEYLDQATMELVTKFYDINYDIIIDDGESSPTARIASTQSAKELLQYAQALPPMAVMTIVKAIIDMSDFPGKEEILSTLVEQEQLSAMQAIAGEGEEAQG
tara:strand:- start:1650 stop:3536 length:1887 start_codon:yes stop_codon:yes gene_type:complete